MFLTYIECIVKVWETMVTAIFLCLSICPAFTDFAKGQNSAAKGHDNCVVPRLWYKQWSWHKVLCFFIHKISNAKTIVCLNVHVCLCVCVCVCVCLYVWLYNVCMCVNMYVCMYMCVCVCVCIPIYIGTKSSQNFFLSIF